jgi:serine protease AprX
MGARGESRASGLWGARRGGRGSGGERNTAVKRGLIALGALALAAPLAASAAGGQQGGHADTYVAPALESLAATHPDAAVNVLVGSDRSAGRASDALDQAGYSDSRQLPIVDAAAAEVQARDLPRIAETSGLVIVPDTLMVLDGLGNGRLGRKRNPHGQPTSNELWTSAVGLDRLWSRLPLPATYGPSAGDTPSIAFVDSGIDASRDDFAGRIRAQVTLASLSGNSPGDGRGHGTFVAGLAAGDALRHAGAAPDAGIVSIDVMDDRGMARTSDVIAAAQWILRNQKQYDIRVVNFSLQSASRSSFRWDPLDKAIEKLWFSGVVVVTSAGNYGTGHSTRVAYGPANDPFVIGVGALDLNGSAEPARATVPNWSTWGYTPDGFAKPELSAPGRSLVGPIPADSTLARERPGQILAGTGEPYMKLSGTSLSAPIVAGIAADILMLHPTFTPDQVKGALMMAARPVPGAGRAAGVGEVYAPTAAALDTPPNPNQGLNAFLVPDPGGGDAFDDAKWLSAARASPAWDSVSWVDGWAGAAWSLVSWSDLSWSDVSWSDVSWSDVSWADVSWSDVSWADTYSDVDP